jgi:hypothetical protein
MVKIKKTIKRSPKKSIDSLTLIKERVKNFKIVGKDIKGPFVLLFLWLFFCAVLSTFPNFNWLFSAHGYSLPFIQSWIAALLLLGLMILYVRFFMDFRNQAINEDISSFWAKIILLTAFILSIGLCLYHMDKPTGGYTEDCAFFVRTIRRGRDLVDYGPAFIFEHGLLPAWPYTAFFFWHFLPSCSEIQRLTGTFFDLATILFLYFSGKEIAGRRLGLFAAALGAVSKPLLSKVVSGYPSHTLAMGVALAVWMTMRLERKNKISDFLLWGASVGFLAYTTAPFEPFIPFFIFISLVLIEWKNQKPVIFFGAHFLIWLSMIFFLVYYLCCNNAFPNSTSLLGQVKIFSPWIFLIVLLSVGFLFLQKGFESENDLWAKWFLGSWLATIFSFPEISNVFMIGRIQDHSLISGAGFLSTTYLKACLQRIPDSIRWLFWSCNDKSDMSPVGDIFFSYPETILLGLGLVFCIAKPGKKRIFLVLTALLGVAPHLFADAHHSGLLIGCAAPCLLIGAVGLNDLLKIIKGGLSRVRFSDLFIVILLIAFWGWAAAGVFSRVYTQWAERRVNTMEEAAQGAARGYRVYLIADVPPEYYEGPALHYFHEFNPIDLSSDEKVPDVVMYIDMRRGELRNKVIKTFPDAKWKNLYSPDDPTKPVVFRCEIPANDLLRKNQRIFTVSRIPGSFWKRDYMAAHSYLNLSLIDWEDGVVDVNQPLPPSANIMFDAETIKLESKIQMKHGGRYEITCETGNRSKVLIDNQEIFDLTFPRIGSYVAPPEERKVLLNLKAGDHQVEVISCFQTSYAPPDITIRGIESTGKGQSLWKSFSFD